MGHHEILKVAVIIYLSRQARLGDENQEVLGRAKDATQQQGCFPGPDELPAPCVHVEFLQDEAATWREHARYLRYRGVVIPEVVESVHAKDAVEGLVLERERLGNPADEVDPVPSPRLSQHSLGRVQDEGACPVFQETSGHLAGPATQVEEARAGLEDQKLPQASLRNAAMQPLVDRRYRTEGVKGKAQRHEVMLALERDPATNLAWNSSAA